MIDTNISLAKLQGAEEITNEIVHALVNADDVHRPGLEAALALADKTRIGLSNYHVRMCAAAARQALAEAAADMATGPVPFMVV